MTGSWQIILSTYTKPDFLSILVILETINFQDAHLSFTCLSKSEFYEPVCLDI
jgi:hypothetical protein